MGTPTLDFLVRCVKGLVVRVLWFVKEFFVMPVRILSWGGWPKYTFIFVHIFVGIKVLYDLTSFVGRHVSPPVEMEELAPNYSLDSVPDYKSPNAPAVALSEERRREVREELQKQSAYCASLEPNQQRWCEANTGWDLLTAWNAYWELRETTCEWKDDTKFQFRYYELDEDSYYEKNLKPEDPNYDVTDSTLSGAVRGEFNAELGEHGAPYVNFQWGAFDHGYTKRSCKFEAKPKDRGHWYVNRVGPFNSRDKGSWHALWWEAFKEFQEEWTMPNNFGRFITGSMITILDSKGRIIGYPPAHMHHWHLYQVDPLVPVWPHVVFDGMETHGDDACSQEGLGPICYMKWFPPGYGINVPPRFFVEGLVNYVADPPDPTLFSKEESSEFWVEVAIAITEPKANLKIEPIIGMPVMIKTLPHWTPADAGTYVIPKDSDSMVWQVDEWPIGVDLQWWKWHAHYYFTYEAWIVVGDGRAIFGLDSTPYVQTGDEYKPDDVIGARHDPSGLAPMKEFDGDLDEYLHYRRILPNFPPEVPHYKTVYMDVTASPLENIENAKADLLHKFRAYNGKQRAEGKEEAQIFMKVDDIDRFHSQVGDHKWTHRPNVLPSKTHFDKGDKVTIIGFHRRIKYLCGDACEDSKQPVRLHLINAFLVKPTDPDASFFTSPAGRRFLYRTRYYTKTIGVLLFIAISSLAATAVWLFMAGKCAPVAGPCAEKQSTKYELVTTNEKDDKLEKSAFLA